MKTRFLNEMASLLVVLLLFLVRVNSRSIIPIVRGLLTSRKRMIIIRSVSG